MPKSPHKDADGVVTVSVLSAGKSVDKSIAVLSVSVNKRVNKISYATLVLLDGDMPEQDFPLSNGDSFKPGVEIEIKAGYASDESTIFKGTVVRHGIRIDSSNNACLVVECRDKAAAMTLGRNNANYVDKKDSEIISALIGDCPGVTADVDATTVKHPELVQYYCTDWDFMLSRAEASGLLVLVDDGKVSVKAPDGSAAPKLVVTYGADLMEFEADVDARTQLKSVTAAAWDLSQQKVISAKAAAKSVTQQGNLKSADLAAVLNLDSFRLQTAARADESVLTAWSKAQQQKAALAAIQGRVKFQGNALARIGSVLELAGVGERFNGNVYVGAVNHEIAAGNWITEVEFGLPSAWFAERRDLAAPSAAGLLPGVDGLQIGVVKKLEKDPDSQVRVQVSVPVLEAETDGIWARLATFYGSEGIGAFFIPEIGDEVVLGYLNNDPGQPVILGSLHSSKRKPPYPRVWFLYWAFSPNFDIRECEDIT